MGSKFECIIKIKGHTFDIEIEDSPHNTFGFIFPKIKEIAAIAANEEIYLSTHEFHIIDDISGWKAEKTDQIIKNKSTIYISPVVEPKVTPVLPPVVTPVVPPVVTPVFTRLVPPVVRPVMSYPYDVDMRGVSSADNQRQFRPPITMRLPPKPTLKQWSQLSEEKRSQSTQLTESSPQKSTSRERVVKQTDKSIAKSVPLRVDKLKKDENDIKLFHVIVMSINIGWDLRDTDNPNWDLVHRRAKAHKSPLRVAIPSSSKIVDNFFYWSGYYAQNYDSFDGSLEPSYQQIFDLLKVVHILDLSQLYSRSDRIAIKIKQIFDTKELQHYYRTHLSTLWREKRDNEIVVKNKRNDNDFNNNTRSTGRSDPRLKRRNEISNKWSGDRHYHNKY